MKNLVMLCLSQSKYDKNFKYFNCQWRSRNCDPMIPNLKLPSKNVVNNF